MIRMRGWSGSSKSVRAAMIVFMHLPLLTFSFFNHQLASMAALAVSSHLTRTWLMAWHF